MQQHKSHVTKALVLGTLFFSFSPIQQAAAAETIHVGVLASAPQLDGSAADWQGQIAQTVSLSQGGSKLAVTVKAGRHGQNVYFLFQWPDSTADNSYHKPFVWNATKKKYEVGPQREDRFALQFAMEGDYDANWLSGKTFKADMWHWKATRSNPIGIAHDKTTTISTVKTKKTFKIKAENGQMIYITRSSDQGDKLYTTKRYRRYEKDTMPKYIMNAKATGSITDVKASGVWKNGKWTLELQRALNTGHADDVVLPTNGDVAGALALFDHSGDAHHFTSGTLTFTFADSP